MFHEYINFSHTRHLHISHNTPCLPLPPSQIWYKHCFQFLLGQVCKTQEKLKRKVTQYSGRDKQGVQNNDRWGCPAEGAQSFCSLLISFVFRRLYPDMTVTLASLFQGM